MAKFDEVLVVSDSDEDDELEVLSENIVRTKTSLELTPVEERRLLEQLGLDPNVAAKIRVSSAGGGGVLRGLVGMGKVVAQCKVVSGGIMVKEKKLESHKIFEPAKRPTKDAALASKLSEIMTISSDDSEEEPEPDYFRKVTLRKLKKPSRVTDHLIKQNRERALGGAGLMPDLGGGAGQHGKRLGDAQDTSLSLSVSGNNQSLESVTDDITLNLQKESPTETSSVQDKINQETCSITESTNQDKSRSQVHPENHYSANQAVHIESQVTADPLGSQETVEPEIATSIQVESVEQDEVQIEELLLSENLEISQVAFSVISEENTNQQEISAQEERSVTQGVTASSTLKISHPGSSCLRTEFSFKLPAEPARFDVSDKQVSPVTCELEAVASNKFTGKASSNEDITDDTTASYENITDQVPSSEDFNDEAPSSEEFTDNATSSGDITDKTPSSDRAPYSEDTRVSTGWTSDLINPGVQGEDEVSPIPTQSLLEYRTETQTTVDDDSNTARLLNPSSLILSKSSPDPEQVSSPPSPFSLGITAVRPGKLFLPTTKLSQLYPPGTIVDVVSVCTNLREDLVWDGWAVSHVSLETAVRVLDKYGDVFGMRKELLVRQQLGEMRKEPHHMEEQTGLAATCSEVLDGKENFLSMFGLCRVEEVSSRVAEIDCVREVARSTTRLRSGNRRKQSPWEGMTEGKRPRAVNVRNSGKKNVKKGKGKKRK